MGGSTISDITDTATGVVKDTVKVTTGGVVNIDDGLKVNLNPVDAGKDWISGATGGNTTKSLMPEMPKMPAAPNAADQARRAEAVAKEKVKSETGAERGLASTITGGSTSDDNSILRKKKLLGE